LGGFFKFTGKGSANVAEHWGVLEGLSLVGRLNFRAVELPMDYVVVVVKAISATDISQ
jgi:hypothetical protein